MCTFACLLAECSICSMDIRVIFTNIPNVTNMMSNLKVHFYKKNNVTNMMSNF